MDKVKKHTIRVRYVILSVIGFVLAYHEVACVATHFFGSHDMLISVIANMKAIFFMAFVSYLMSVG